MHGALTRTFHAPAAAEKDTAEGMEGVETASGPATAPAAAREGEAATAAAALQPAAPLFQDATLDRLIQLASSVDVPPAAFRGPGAATQAEGAPSQGAAAAEQKPGLGEGLDLVGVRDWPEEKGEELEGVHHATPGLRV